MAPYQFQIDDFALSDHGIHLLRNRFNYKTISYDQVQKAIVRNAIEVKNAPILLAFGTLLLAFAFYQSRWVVELFSDPRTYKIYIESIVLPFIPASLGTYCFYTALRKGPVLQIGDGKTIQRLRLRPLYKTPAGPDFEQYLNLKLGNKLMIDASTLQP